MATWLHRTKLSAGEADSSDTSPLAWAKRHGLASPDASRQPDAALTQALDRLIQIAHRFPTFTLWARRDDLLSHLEMVRQTCWSQHRPEGTFDEWKPEHRMVHDAGTLVRALYLRSSPPPALADALRADDLDIEAVSDPRIRAVLLTLQATEAVQVDVGHVALKVSRGMLDARATATVLLERARALHPEYFFTWSALTLLDPYDDDIPYLAERYGLPWPGVAAGDSDGDVPELDVAGRPTERQRQAWRQWVVSRHGMELLDEGISWALEGHPAQSVTEAGGGGWPAPVSIRDMGVADAEMSIYVVYLNNWLDALRKALEAQPEDPPDGVEALLPVALNAAVRLCRRLDMPATSDHSWAEVPWSLRAALFTTQVQFASAALGAFGNRYWTACVDAVEKDEVRRGRPEEACHAAELFSLGYVLDFLTNRDQDGHQIKDAMIHLRGLRDSVPYAVTHAEFDAMVNDRFGG